MPVSRQCCAGKAARAVVHCTVPSVDAGREHCNIRGDRHPDTSHLAASLLRAAAEALAAAAYMVVGVPAGCCRRTRAVQGAPARQVRPRHCG